MVFVCMHACHLCVFSFFLALPLFVFASLQKSGRHCRACHKNPQNPTSRHQKPQKPTKTQQTPQKPPQKAEGTRQMRRRRLWVVAEAKKTWS